MTGRSQYVSINGVDSESKDMLCGVPQGSVLGPLLFLIFINDLPSSIEFFTLLFADDTTLQLSGSNLNDLYAKANIELSKAQKWFEANRLTLNVKKTKYILFRTASMNVDFSNYSLKLDGKKIDRIGQNCEETTFKFVGHYLDEYLMWDTHINHIIGKLASANYAIGRTKNLLPLNIRTNLYNSLFKSHLEFGILAFGCAKTTKLKKISLIQKKCIRNVKNVEYRAHTDPLFFERKFLKFEDLFKYNVCNFMHKYGSNLLPASFQGLFTRLSDTDERNNRDAFYNYKMTNPKHKALNRFPRVVFPQLWNSLSSLLQSTISHKIFKNELKKALIENYGEFVACDNLQCTECKNRE